MAHLIYKFGLGATSIDKIGEVQFLMKLGRGEETRKNRPEAEILGIFSVEAGPYGEFLIRKSCSALWCKIRKTRTLECNQDNFSSLQYPMK